MTYQNDPNTNRRNDIRDDAKYTSWITYGAVALAIFIAAAAFTSTGNYPNRPQTTTNAPGPSPSTNVPDKSLEAAKRLSRPMDL